MPLFETDPLQSYSFSVNVAVLGGSTFSGYFKEVSGISLEFQTIEYKTFNRETGRPQSQQLPGRLTPGTMTFKRGMTTDLSFWIWCQMIVYGELNLARATVSVFKYDRSYFPRLMWTLFNAWPSKFSVGQLAADDNDYLLEELTLVYERAEMIGV
jgi:phage tail-like protein